VTRRLFSFCSPNGIQNLHSAHERSQEPALIPFRLRKKRLDPVRTGFIASQGKKSRRVENEASFWRHLLVAGLVAVL
jgi:hypothetical protein